MNIETATYQDLFDAAVRGLASQGWERSMDENDDVCAYRGECGRKCAIGWLIDKDDYRPEIEGYDASKIFACTNQKMQFLQAMQNAHDGHAKPQLMLSEFMGLSEDYKLEWPADVGKTI